MGNPTSNENEMQNEYGTNLKFMDFLDHVLIEPDCSLYEDTSYMEHSDAIASMQVDYDKETSNNANTLASCKENNPGIGIKNRTRQFPKLPTLGFQGTANRKLPVNAILLSKQNHFTNLGFNKETLDEKSCVTEVDHSPNEDTGIIIRTRQTSKHADLPFQGTANRRIRLQSQLQVGHINQKKTTFLGTNEENLEVGFMLFFPLQKVF